MLNVWAIPCVRLRLDLSLGCFDKHLLSVQYSDSHLLFRCYKCLLCSLFGFRSASHSNLDGIRNAHLAFGHVDIFILILQLKSPITNFAQNRNGSLLTGTDILLHASLFSFGTNDPEKRMSQNSPYNSWCGHN